MNKLSNYLGKYQTNIEAKEVTVKTKNNRHIVKVKIDIENIKLNSDKLNSIINSMNDETSGIFYYRNGSFLIAQINAKERIGEKELRTEIESLLASMNSILTMLEVMSYEQ